MLSQLPISQKQSELLPKSRILVVEDEQIIRSVIINCLEKEGYEVTPAENGREAINLLDFGAKQDSENNFDLVVLDIALSNGVPLSHQVNGLDICRLLRRHENIIPILIISARASETDRVLGLEVGADDYLTKPFGLPEFIARCRALLRRQRLGKKTTSLSIKEWKDISLCTETCTVKVRGKEVNLSPKEFRLLELFMSYPQRVWPREQLIEQIWGIDYLGDTKTVDVHVRWLREKLELDASQPKYLVTVRGFGYRFG